jgi:hypothetical protein
VDTATAARHERAEPGRATGPADSEPGEPFFLRRLREHLGAEPALLPVVTQDFDTTEHPNMQVALDTYLAAEGRQHELLGILSDHKRHMGVGITELLMPERPGMMGPRPPSVGPVEYVNVPVGDERMLTCIQSGLLLARDGERPFVALLNGPTDQGPWRRARVEVIAPRKEDSERFLAELRTLVRQHNVYRGHVLSLDVNMYGALGLHFHKLPNVARDQIILPEGVLERVERHTVGFARHRERLLAAGRHLKRGLLLHGPPGTGKTLTAMYLATQMRERTILMLTGRSLGLIQQTCRLARMVQPAMVIMEDVDLVAEERTRPDRSAGPLLFELLNEMDGLADDADIIFLLTTNRPDLLEPALAARPGRIDQAVEIPLPDANGRWRLFELYGRGLALDIRDWEHVVGRTEGASGAFIRELLRKAALFAADEGDELRVEDRHLSEALRELVVEGGELTQRLLGVAAAPSQR